MDVALVEDESPEREVGSCDKLEEFLRARVRIVGEVDERIHELGEVMRRDFGCHADCNPHGAVEKQIGNCGREDGRLLVHTVKVGNKIHCLFFNIAEHFGRETTHLCFRVAVRGGRVPVNGAKVSLPGHQRVAG